MCSAGMVSPCWTNAVLCQSLQRLAMILHIVLCVVPITGK